MMGSLESDITISLDYGMSTEKPFKRVNYGAKYWWKGMRIELSVIADCLCTTVAKLKGMAKEENKSMPYGTTQERHAVIQTYLKHATRTTVTKQKKRNGRVRTGKIIIDGLTVRDITNIYDIPKSTLNMKISKNDFKTLDDLVKGYNKIG